MRGTSGRAAPELPRRRRIDGLAVRSWMLPRAHEPAPAKRKIGGSERIANGTAGQTQAFSLANPVGSMGFRELLVRTSAHGAVRKYRGRIAKPPPRMALAKKRLECPTTRPAESFEMHPQNDPGCKRRALWEIKGLLD